MTFTVNPDTVSSTFVLGADEASQRGFEQRTVPVVTLDHLVEGVREGHAAALLAASIFHFGTYSIGEAKAHLAAHGVPVRLPDSDAGSDGAA